MSTPAVTETQFLGAVVPVTLAVDIRDLAKERERSVAAEIRLALRAWIDSERAAA